MILIHFEYFINILIKKLLTLITRYVANKIVFTIVSKNNILAKNSFINVHFTAIFHGHFLKVPFSISGVYL